MNYYKNDKFNYTIYEKLLSKNDCESLIGEFTSFRQARTYGSSLQYDEENRKAQNAIYKDESIILKKVRKIFAEKTNTNIIQQETPISFIKYDKGGEYKPHFDFYENLKIIKNPEMGNRLKTIILYLNDNYIGGETNFPILGHSFKCDQGDILTWNNLNENGTPNTDTLHAGLPVIEGTKYIIITWIRENLITGKMEKTLI